MSRVIYRPAMPEVAYHSHPALSSTGARKLLISPATFKHWQDNPEEPKREFELGSAIHTLVLGTGYGVEVLDERFKDFRTNDAKNAAADAREAGRIPVLAHVYERAKSAAEAVLKHPTARTLAEQPGRPEVSVFSIDPETGVEQRARFDFLPLKTGRRRIAWDLKSVGTSATASAFARSVARFGYDVAQEHYLHVISPVERDPSLEFAFVCVETEPPHNVAVHALSERFAEIGAAKAARARRLFAECMRSGEWPGYPPGVTVIEPPMFHVYDHIDAEEAEQ